MASTLKRRKATPKDEAPAEQAAPKRTLSTRAIDPAKVAAQAKAALGGGGGGTNFLKLDKDKTTIRILPGDPLFLSFRQNMTRVAGRFNTTLDFEGVFGSPELHQRALAEGKITADDFAKFQQFGDPFTSTMLALKNAGVKLAKGQAFWPQTRAVFSVINRADGKVYLWEASKTAFENIMTHFGKLNDEGVFEPGEYPELFNVEDGFDLVITGNGQDGKARRYTAYTPARQQSGLGEYEGEPYDLLAQVTRRVSTWDDRARQMFASHGALAAVVGITPETWGISAVISSDDDQDPEQDPTS
jgi:hypothetical protein